MVVVYLPEGDGLENDTIESFWKEELHLTATVQPKNVETLAIIGFGNAGNDNCVTCGEDLKNSPDWGANQTGAWARCPTCKTITQWDDSKE